MTAPRISRRVWGLLAFVVPLLLLLAYVALRTGPFATIAVTAASAESRAIAPALAGIGTVQARYSYQIGPTAAGRVRQLAVQVGDTVRAGQLLGEMDPVDLDERIAAQRAALASAEAALQQALARLAYARTQAQRYAQLLAARGTSEEILAARQHELALAEAAQAAARADLGRLQAEARALAAQRGHLRLLAPVAGLVSARGADPGSTVVAGQAVVELIDAASVWVDTRFEQIGAQGLAAGLPARIVLRSRRDEALAARVLRVEPRADAVTEETLAKLSFDALPSPLPPLGELVEVTVQLPALPVALTIPNAAIRTRDGQRGVWKLVDGAPEFAPLVLGRFDLEGRVQVLQGLAAGERFVVYSERILSARSRVQVVDRISGAAR